MSKYPVEAVICDRSDNLTGVKVFETLLSESKSSALGTIIVDSYRFTTS